MNGVEKIWKRIKSWANANARKYQAVTIASPDAEPVRPHSDYFRVWLSEMYLAERREWFQDWYPAVNTSVRLMFGDNSTPITLSHIAQAPQKVHEAVLLDFPVTDLLPYRGGVVEVEAALVGLKGENALGAAIKVLESFSGLVGAPLVQALDVAGKVAGGIEDLLDSTKGDVRLGYHRGFQSSGGGDAANILREGHIVVILATKDEIAGGRLSLVDNQLHYSKKEGANAEPLTGFDYMTFRIERREERDDWRLSTISDPLNKAIDAMLAPGREDEAKAFKQAAIMAAFKSDDLSVVDRRRVVKAIKEELEEIEKLGLGAVGHNPRDLNQVRKARVMGLTAAAAFGEMTLEEALAD
jgi:hypothetical protein